MASHIMQSLVNVTKITIFLKKKITKLNQQKHGDFALAPQNPVYFSKDLSLQTLDMVSQFN